MDDDDKFWQTPQGHSWVKPTTSRRRKLSDRQRSNRADDALSRGVTVTSGDGSGGTTRTPQETATYYLELAAFFRRTDDRSTADYWERRANAIKARFNGGITSHG